MKTAIYQNAEFEIHDSRVLAQNGDLTRCEECFNRFYHALALEGGVFVACTNADARSVCGK